MLDLIQQQSSDSIFIGIHVSAHARHSGDSKSWIDGGSGFPAAICNSDEKQFAAGKPLSPIYLYFFLFNEIGF
jgi:hypothetical protein